MTWSEVLQSAGIGLVSGGVFGAIVFVMLRER